MQNSVLLLLENLLIADMQKTQLWLVAGFMLLGWVMARRQVKERKRVNRDSRAANRELAKIRNRKEPAVPLCDAPAETQRWQAAIFDLQRELKAELDTRIGIVQSLIRVADQRIAQLEALGGPTNLHEQMTDGNEQAVTKLIREGHTATEIATKTGLPVGDIEMTIATIVQT